MCILVFPGQVFCEPAGLYGYLGPPDMTALPFDRCVQYGVYRADAGGLMFNRSYGCVAELEDPVPVMQEISLHSGADPVPPVISPLPIREIVPGSRHPQDVPTDRS
jgi:hypothetical protein